jgi:hypothetical protein
MRYQGRKVLEDFYYTAELATTDGGTIYALKKLAKNKSKTFYFKDSLTRHNLSLWLEKELGLINQNALSKALDKGDALYLHQQQIDKYRLNTRIDYWPFELTISGKKIFLIENFNTRSFSCYLSAAERFENFISKQEFFENGLAKKLLTDNQLDQKITRLDQYAAFDIEGDVYLFCLKGEKLHGKVILKDELQTIRSICRLEVNVLT